MTRSIKLWFEIAAYAITVTAALAIVALAVRLGDGLATATAILTAFFCVFVGIGVRRRRIPRRDPASTSIKDELELRKLRAGGAKIQFR
jgi:hypothetical protein